MKYPLKEPADRRGRERARRSKSNVSMRPGKSKADKRNCVRISDNCVMLGVLPASAGGEVRIGRSFWHCNPQITEGRFRGRPNSFLAAIAHRGNAAARGAP